MEDASGWEEATHPLVQTTEERRDVNGSDGGGEDAAAAAGPEPCQSAIVGGLLSVKNERPAGRPAGIPTTDGRRPQRCSLSRGNPTMLFILPLGPTCEEDIVKTASSKSKFLMPKQ